MQLDDYFEFVSPLDIRVRGTRVGIKTILHDYLSSSLVAEDITARYPTLTIEQVYATLTYYWHNREQVDAYLHRVDEAIAQQRREQDEHPLPAVLRLRVLARQRDERRSRAATL